MDQDYTSAHHRCFATFELLEAILLHLLTDLHDITAQEDPRSVKTHHNAKQLRKLVRLTLVDRRWCNTIRSSTLLQRALFLQADLSTCRTWQHHPTDAVRLRSYYRAPAKKAPTLNPVVQTQYPSYHFRFWQLSLEVSGNKHVAYLIIDRNSLTKPALSYEEALRQDADGHRESNVVRKSSSGIDRMLLSQPPMEALEAIIWDQRDYETNEHVDEATHLQDAIVRCEGGITLGLVHAKALQMFDAHQGVSAIKFTTI